MTVQLSPETLPVISYRDITVITTELLANFYETDDVRIRQAFNRNQERFIEGKHYFKLENEELREFKKSLSSLKILSEPGLAGFVSVSANTKSLILWTERGAARHAKVIETGKAWEVYEQLEDAYFHRDADAAFIPPPQTKSIPSIKDQLYFVKEVSKTLRLSETSKMQLLANVAINTGLPTNLIPAYSDEGLTMALGDLLKKNGSKLSAVKANPILQSLGYLERLERRTSNGEMELFWNVTDSGLKYGKNNSLKEKANKTAPVWYVSAFPELLAEIEGYIASTNAKPDLRIVPTDNVGATHI